MEEKIDHSQRFKVGDKITTIKKLSLPDRYYSEIGDVWTVFSSSDYFTGVERGDMKFSLNNSSINRHFKLVE